MTCFGRRGNLKQVYVCPTKTLMMTPRMINTRGHLLVYFRYPPDKKMSPLSSTQSSTQPPYQFGCATCFCEFSHYFKLYMFLVSSVILENDTNKVSFSFMIFKVIEMIYTQFSKLGINV